MWMNHRRGRGLFMCSRDGIGYTRYFPTFSCSFRRLLMEGCG